MSDYPGPAEAPGRPAVPKPACDNRMQLLADYFPLILFFVAFKWQGIYVATAVAIVASIAQIACFSVARARSRRCTGCRSRSSSCSAARRCILQDEMFIKWKPTVLYGAVRRRPGGRQARLPARPDRRTCCKDVTLPPAVWSTRDLVVGGVLRRRWRVLNWYVAFHFSTDTWVNFKVWGGIGLVPACSRVAQGLCARPPHEEPEPSHDAPPP